MFLVRRPELVGMNVGLPAERGERLTRAGLGARGGAHAVTFPPAIARAIALTTNVRTNSTKPAAM